MSPCDIIKSVKMDDMSFSATRAPNPKCMATDQCCLFNIYFGDRADHGYHVFIQRKRNFL